ncbi:MAG: amphi-Trp domain-containing protein [Bacteroidetes bacterium]|nr:MAG: amphi-Trp domain-containing protein [Bacteroidota bacterium]
MKKKSNRDVVKDVSRSVFIAKLRRLADALESNKSFTIQIKKDRLYIPADAIVSLEHERSGKQEELEFQISWERK